MPHQFQSINCKKCGEHLCPVCKDDKCPKCDEVDIPDKKTQQVREQMRKHMNQKNIAGSDPAMHEQGNHKR